MEDFDQKFEHLNEFVIPFKSTHEDVERDTLFSCLILQSFTLAHFDYFPFELIVTIMSYYLNEKPETPIKTKILHGKNIATIHYVEVPDQEKFQRNTME